MANGAADAIPDEHTPVDSPGARLIIAESLLASADDRAVRRLPRAAHRHGVARSCSIPRSCDRPVTVIWIGGEGTAISACAGRLEFNLSNDIAAANVVFDSGITLWQVPRSVYPMVSVSYAELEEKIGGTSELADYLIRQLKEWNATYHPGPIESRSLGDSPAISLLLYPQGGVFRTVPAPRFGAEGRYVPGSGHPLQVCESVDVRFLLEDMFAKIRRFGAGKPPVPPLNVVPERTTMTAPARLRRRHLALRHLPGPLRHRGLRGAGGPDRADRPRRRRR